MGLPLGNASPTAAAAGSPILGARFAPTISPMKFATSIVLIATLALTACATVQEPPPDLEPPPTIHDNVLSLTGAHPKPCGLANLADEKQRLAGYACIQSALNNKQPFWFAEIRVAAGGFGFAWAGSPSGKVYQILTMGKGFTTTECKRFEVTLKKGGNIHCTV